MSADEIETDIKTLETFVKEVRERQKKAQKAADELVRPPKAKVAAKRADSGASGGGKMIA